MNYRFIEVSLASRDVQAQEDFWVKMFDAKVIFRGRMMSQPFTRIIACGITLIFREDPQLALPPGPGEERQFRQHLGLRVDDLEASIAELEAKGAKFVMSPALARQYQKTKQDSGATFFETTFIAPPLSRERITAGEFRHDVAIFVGPDNVWIELNDIKEPADTQWYPSLEAK